MLASFQNFRAGTTLALPGPVPLTSLCPNMPQLKPQLRTTTEVGDQITVGMQLFSFHKLYVELQLRGLK